MLCKLFSELITKTRDGDEKSKAMLKEICVLMIRKAPKEDVLALADCLQNILVKATRAEVGHN